MKFDNKAYIKLYKKYHLFKLEDAKLFNQRVELFTIFDKYDKLIYKFKSFQDLKNIFDDFYRYIETCIKERRFIL